MYQHGRLLGIGLRSRNFSDYGSPEIAPFGRAGSGAPFATMHSIDSVDAITSKRFEGDQET
jgi:hypothetical protein